MESSFLTFSPRALARKKLSSSATLRLTKSRLLKSKSGPLTDVCSSPSNVHNIKKNERRSFTNKKDNLDAIVLDDSVVVLSDECGSIKNSGCEFPPTISHFKHDKKHNSLSPPSSKRVTSNQIQGSSLQGDKFDEIKQWLDELHSAHEEKKCLPAWSPLSPPSCASKNNTNFNSCTSNSRGKPSSNWRIPESSSDESVRPGSARRAVISSTDESGGDTSDQSELPAAKSVTEFRCLDNSSESSSKDVLPNIRKGSNKCSRTSITSDESIISTSSADRIISELYGRSWDKQSVLTPKTVKRKTVQKCVSQDDASSIEELLTQLYSNSWDKEKVLTPLVSKTKGVKGKENTPPVPRDKVKVDTFNSKCPTNRINSPKCTPASTRSGTKAKSQETLSFLRSLSISPPSSQCNSQALLYKKEFRKHKETLCSDLFKLFNDEIFENKLPSTLKIDWNIRLNRTAGFCHNSWITRPEGKVRSSRIELSTKVCSSADRVRDTLVHELCHAATWVVDGSKNHHGAEWKAWTRKAMKKFPELPRIGRCHSYNIETKYSYKCKRCGYSIGRHSKSLDLQRKRCGYCYGEFELLVNAKTRRVEGGSPSTSRTPRAPRAASGFALYVKENYKATKEKNYGLKHAEIMKILGNQFSGMKVGSVH